MIDAYDSAQVGGVWITKADRPGVSSGVVASDPGSGGLSAAWAGFIPDIDLSTPARTTPRCVASATR